MTLRTVQRYGISYLCVQCVHYHSNVAENWQIIKWGFLQSCVELSVAKLKASLGVAQAQYECQKYEAQIRQRSDTLRTLEVVISVLFILEKFLNKIW